MKFYSYFFILFFVFSNCFGITPQEIMSYEYTIHLFYKYIEREYKEGHIAAPYCVLTCVITEKINYQACQPKPLVHDPEKNDVHAPLATNYDPRSMDNLCSFLLQPEPKKENRIEIKNGVLSFIYGCFSFGVDLIGLAWFAYKNIDYAVKKSRIEKAFVCNYQEWRKEDFQREALRLINTCRPIDATDIVLSAPDQEAILSEYHLYQFDGFQSYIKTLPLYEPFIKTLHSRVHCDDRDRTNRWWKKFPGYFNDSFPSIVTSLREQVDQEELDRKKREQAEIDRKNKAAQEKRMHMEQYLNYYAVDMHDYADEYALAIASSECDNGVHAERLSQRLQAIEASESKRYELQTKSYALSPQLDDFLQDRCIHPDIFRQCEGSEIQHCLQQEMIMILEHTAEISFEYEQGNDPSVTFFTETISNFVLVSAEYNQAGHIKQALILNDNCWSFLDCAIGTLQGLAQGAYNRPLLKLI
ncbi:MAG TPA: hypothetical protein VGT41_02910 [Candidatus Babeliales bacterium]|nr:hypothetical protein [Candidatus Babeliales bacterium]